MICEKCIWVGLDCDPDEWDNCEYYDPGEEYVPAVRDGRVQFLEEWKEYIDDEDLLFF